jgi:hypothetical protein
MKKYVFLFALLVLLGCDLIVDVDVPMDRQGITLNSFFSPDSLWAARLKLNRYILSDNRYAVVEDALVVVYENEKPIDTLAYESKGVYRSDTGKPVVGKRYDIKVTSSKYNSVGSSSYIPEPPANAQWEITGEIEIEGVGLPYKLIDLNFTDNANETNFYKITGLVEHPIIDPDGTLAPFRRSLELSTESDSENFGDYEVIISDLTFNGLNHKMQIRVLDVEKLVVPKLIMSISSISQDYYDYKQTERLQAKTIGNPFAQPTNVYNNVEGGFGIFAGYSTAFVVKENPKPVITNISPLRGKPGDHVVIQFETIGPMFADLQGGWTGVNFTGGPRAQIVRSTPNEIEVIVPRKSVTGKLLVMINGAVTESGEVFEIIN